MTRPPRRLRRPLRPLGPARPTLPLDEEEALWEREGENEEDSAEATSPFPSDYVARLFPSAYLKGLHPLISGSPWALVHSPDELAGFNLDTTAILTLLGYPESVIATARPQQYLLLVFELPHNALRVLATWPVVKQLAKNDPAGRFEHLTEEDWDAFQAQDWTALAAAAAVPGADPITRRRYRLRVQLKYAFSVHEHFSGQGYTRTTLAGRNGIGVEEWYIATRSLEEIGLYKTLFLR